MISVVPEAKGQVYLAVCAVTLVVCFACQVARHDRGASGLAPGRKNDLAVPSERSPKLEVSSVLRHGRIVEIEGSANPGDTVMINGETAATFFDGNGFKHFVGPLPTGLSIVTITVQDNHGGVTTRRLAITME